MSDLYRLVYTSFRSAECDDMAIQDILTSCKKNNPKREVTGLLLHSDNRFLQYMEGNKAEVEALYTLIQSDPRHSNIQQRNFEPITDRVFPSWEMGYKDVSSKELVLYAELSSEDKQLIQRLIEGEVDFSNDGIRALQLFYRA